MFNSQSPQLRANSARRKTHFFKLNSKSSSFLSGPRFMMSVALSRAPFFSFFHHKRKQENELKEGLGFDTLGDCRRGDPFFFFRGMAADGLVPSPLPSRLLPETRGSPLFTSLHFHDEGRKKREAVLPGLSTTRQSRENGGNGGTFERTEASLVLFPLKAKRWIREEGRRRM
ncbi:hypothetical protein AKJ49_00620 [candidate division MSBL1 archaeon SCGC-AAA382A03]|uniref:Uncharacterized protein n=1 Tax=candidate division MSBL1 archaeon SCGC-AAA382A03 TaxID=1698278 RepID=A0A133VGE1_9EURY|nr:hypothetical protein AKJ49_00620 [candidate division MSBL1 archaeon SCGC-AAA382A03]